MKLKARKDTNYAPMIIIQPIEPQRQGSLSVITGENYSWNESNRFTHEIVGDPQIYRKIPK